ncbi:Tetratricopeptide repeat-containing protein [Roseateles sp. YR242]|uniref:tetratricopeptide repeat protein n=1 Tax=Roseateles sp. YR242 TaxID=1855305 RepID=UPI0008BB6858|nr:tetratricopeptide repeat protein [Roseateles sp. YR242]SEL85783.1 Tetratricopeptide repeat-containing protein [Roseateles sp. YR242]
MSMPMSSIAKPTAALSDYAVELARYAREIAELEPPGADRGRQHRLVYKRYQQASLRGDYAALASVDQTLRGLISAERPDPDLCYLKANLDFKFHRLEGVLRTLQACPDLRDSTPGQALMADLHLQQGRHDEAERLYREVLAQDPTWDNLARLAHLAFKCGEDEVAERYFDDAEDELTVKEMRHYAWLQLQRGVLDLKRGHLQAAREHYDRANRAYTGYWLVAEHRAELLAALGECDEARALYETVLAEVPRPELQQAMGELCAYMGNDAEAELWFGRALDAYLSSAAQGEVHYLHHLADFYADVREDGAQALHWAGADLALRQNPATLAAWAWALYRAGRAGEALVPMQRALDSREVDAHTLERAAVVFQAAGSAEAGQRLAQQAHGLNPHARGFHVHR